MVARITKGQHFDRLSAGHQKFILSRLIVTLGTGTMSTLDKDKDARKELLSKAGLSTSFENVVVSALTNFYKFATAKRATGVPRNNMNPAAGVTGVSFTKEVRQKAQDYLEKERRAYPERTYHIRSYTVGSKGNGNNISVPNRRYEGADVRYAPVRLISIVENNSFAVTRGIESDNTALFEKIGLRPEVYTDFSVGPNTGTTLASNLTEDELLKLVRRVGSAEFMSEMESCHVVPDKECLEEIIANNALGDYIEYTNQDAAKFAEKINNSYEWDIMPDRQLNERYNNSPQL